MDAQRKFTQIVLVIVTIILLAAFVSAAKSEELYNYKVYGQNKQTGLTVAGVLWESDKQGNLRGKVYDEFSVQDQCNGTWVGYGVAQVGCGNGYQYVLRVIEK
jgi:hypothetical protein